MDGMLVGDDGIVIKSQLAICDAYEERDRSDVIFEPFIDVVVLIRFLRFVIAVMQIVISVFVG